MERTGMATREEMIALVDPGKSFSKAADGRGHTTSHRHALLLF
jgi:hypothetical protein